MMMMTGLWALNTSAGDQSWLLEMQSGLEKKSLIYKFKNEFITTIKMVRLEFKIRTLLYL